MRWSKRPEWLRYAVMIVAATAVYMLFVQLIQ